MWITFCVLICSSVLDKILWQPNNIGRDFCHNFIISTCKEGERYTCVHVEYKANANESIGVYSWKIEGKLTLRLLGYVNPFAEEQVAMKGP